MIAGSCDLGSDPRHVTAMEKGATSVKIEADWSFWTLKRRCMETIVVEELRSLKSLMKKSHRATRSIITVTIFSPVSSR